MPGREGSRPTRTDDRRGRDGGRRHERRRQPGRDERHFGASHLVRRRELERTGDHGLQPLAALLGAVSVLALAGEKRVGSALDRGRVRNRRIMPDDDEWVGSKRRGGIVC